jgi:hypothetical protein
MRALIAASFGAEAADAWTKFEPSQDHLQTLASAGREVLTMFPTMPGACAMMSAVYSLRLEKLGAPPAYVVASSLFLGDTRIFGDPPFEAGGKRRRASAGAAGAQRGAPAGASA